MENCELNQMAIPNAAAASDMGSLVEKIILALCHWCALVILKDNTFFLFF